MAKRVTFGCMLILLGGAGFPNASQNEQVNPRLFISTRAGLVTRVVGRAALQPSNGRTPEAVEPNLQMMDGDRLLTESDSRVEVLVRPEAFLRLAERTEIRALDTTLTGARFALQRGSLVVEVSKGGKDLPFEIVSRHSAVTIHTPGLYRIDVAPSGTRVDVLRGEIGLDSGSGMKSQGSTRIGGGNRVELSGPQGNAVTITRLIQKPYDESDSWSFPIARHGAIDRCEGNVLTICNNADQSCRVTTGFQLKEEEWLILGDAGYANLRVTSAEHLSLGPQAQLHAVRTGDDAAVFELKRGPAIATTEAPPSFLYSGGRYGRRPGEPGGQIRPMRIITPHGSFALDNSSVARFDVGPRTTEISVRKGRVIAEGREGPGGNESWIISQGRRIRLEAGSAKPARALPFNRNVMDAFDRWALGLLSIGHVWNVNGRVVVQRRGGGSVVCSAGIQIEEGDRIVSSPGGSTRIQIGPFTYLIVDQASEVRMTMAGGVVQRLELVRGLIILLKFNRPTTFGNRGPLTEVALPRGFATISKSGEYRLRAGESGTKIEVREGFLFFNPGGAADATARIRLKTGQVATLPADNSSKLQISKLP